MAPRKIIAAIFVAVGLAAVLGLVGLVHVFVSGFSQAVKEDQVNSPGMVQFLVEDQQLSAFKDGVALGNSPEAISFASQFSIRLQMLGKAMFGDDSEGHFLTYCRTTPDQIVVLCHVPDLRGAKGDARLALAKVAWLLAQDIAVTQHRDEKTTLVVGLRGEVSYAVVWEGNAVGLAVVKSEGPDCVKHLYPYFIPSPAGH